MRKQGGQEPARKARARAAAGTAPAATVGGALEDAPYPVLRLQKGGTVGYANGAARSVFPGIATGRVSHPVIAGIMAAAGGMTRGTRFVDREEACGDRVWSQRIVREPGGFTVYMTDVTDLRLAREELRLIETHDRLTTLLSRGHFLDRLADAVHAALRYRFPLSVALCDVDGMHRTNDEFGHKAGDEVLAGVGRALNSCLRAEDIAGRYGGDEFGIVFPHTTAYDAVIGVSRIRARLEKLGFHDPIPGAFRVTLSFGIADLSPVDMDERGLVEAALKSLQEAKGRV